LDKNEQYQGLMLGWFVQQLSQCTRRMCPVAYKALCLYLCWGLRICLFLYFKSIF